MARSLLILMLVLTQFLTGSGVRAYLCISGDGLRLDGGPDSCSHCPGRPPEPPKNQCGHGCCPCGHTSQDEPLDNISIPNDLPAPPCGCTHIPILVESQSPTSLGRSSTTIEAEEFGFTIALPIWFAPKPPSVSSAVSRALHPPIPRLALTIVAVAVIRC